VKIVDVSTERQSEQEARRLREETLSEVSLLRLLSGHPSISMKKEISGTKELTLFIFSYNQGFFLNSHLPLCRLRNGSKGGTIRATQQVGDIQREED